MREKNPKMVDARLFIADYNSLRDYIRKTMSYGFRDWIENIGDRNEDYIKSTLKKLFSISTSKIASNQKGNKKTSTQISDDRYFSINDFEKILCLCTFKSEDLFNIIRLLSDISKNIKITHERASVGMKEYKIEI